MSIKESPDWESIRPLKPNELMDFVAENRKLLHSCKKHSFTVPNRPIRKNCGGFMEPICVFAYHDGFKHAGGDTTDIIIKGE